MTSADPPAAAAVCKPRWYQPTPDRFLVGLLAVEGVLLLSERFGWFPCNHHKGWTVLVAIAAVGAALLFMLLWLATSLLLRWRFQYSIRSLLVLTVAVAVPFSWLAVEKKKAAEQKAAVAEIKKLDGFAYHYPTVTPPGRQPAEPPWLIHLLGDNYFGDVEYVNLADTEVTDAGLEQLKGLSNVQELYLANTKVTDAGLERLKGIGQLPYVDLSGTKVTDAGLEHLKGLSQLQVLVLSRTKVTDAGLEHLEGLSRLEVLYLGETEVTDAGLERLKGLSRLQHLYLQDTKVTAQGVKRLQQALPGCDIYPDMAE